MEIMEMLSDEGEKMLEISPAIRSANGKPLSQEEFHQLLYEYFEEKGILTDMRAHLRSQMVNMLRDTGLAKIITLHSEISPKLQALNLLIAEFLLQHHYHYTLSVFTTEVPLTNVFSNFANEFTTQDDPRSKDFRFPNEDLQDILDTLSLPKLQQISVTNEYLSSRTPLLQCLFKPINQDASCDNLENFIDFLTTSKTPPETTLKIIQHLKTLVTAEMEQLARDKDDEINKLKLHQQEETAKLEEHLKKKLLNLEKSHDKDQKRLQRELDAAKSNLRVCAQNLQEKYRDLQHFEEGLKEKEDKLREHEDFLADKDCQLQKQLEVLELQLKKLDADKENRSYQQEAPEDVKYQQPGKTMENMSVENALLKTNVRDLQARVDNLCDQNRIYLNRIQDLAVRTSSLMQELESSQQKVQELNGCVRAAGGGGLFRPLVAPEVGVETRRTKYGIASYNGGGEEGSTLAPLSPRQFRHTDLKRKKGLKKPTTSSTPSTSDDATHQTDAVLNEARQRLLDLQQESNQIDRHFQNLPTTKSSDSKAMTDFHLNVAAIRNNLSKIFSRQYQLPGTSRQFIPVNENIFYSQHSEDKARFKEDERKRQRSFASDEEKVRFSSQSDVEDTRMFRGNEDGLRLLSGQEDRLRINNLIADLPLRANNFEYAVETAKNSEGESGRSSALVLATSFSTVDVSSEHSDGECKGKMVRRRHSRLMEMINLPCLLAFILEILLFK